MQCRFCKQKGASFSCHSRTCRKFAHYKCAIQHHWYFNWGNFTVYCPEHTSKIVYTNQNSQTCSTLTMPNKATGNTKNQMEIEF